MSNSRSLKRRARARSKLAAIQHREETIEQLERDMGSLLDHYATVAPEALDTLIPEERHQLLARTWPGSSRDQRA